MDIVRQKLVVQEWPLKTPGDEQFFGYVVAMGIVLGVWDGTEDIADYSYVDFAYNDGYVRYRLPADEELIKRLLHYLTSNMWELRNCDTYCGKVWIKKTAQGYAVDMP